jgi:hypothetical protein
VIADTSRVPAIAYARSHRSRRNSGQHQERVMSSTSRTQPSHVFFAAEQPSAQSQDTRQDFDAEDRRWALEWARRNVED